MNKTDPKTIVALDYPDAESANAFVDRVNPELCKLKVGFELFVAAGPGFVESLAGKGYDVFLDLKFHDIPNTVASACRTASSLGVWMINVHASGGSTMMEAARNAVDQSEHQPKLIAVTVLTSMDDADLAGVNVSKGANDQALYLSGLAKAAGMDGVVCSAREAAAMREQNGEGFLLVTPGIRPAGSEQGDQKRIVTPADAFSWGADYLVVGRPVTQSDDPLAVLRDIEASRQ